MVFRNSESAEEVLWTKYPTSATPAVTVSTNGLVMSSTSQTGVTTTFGYDGLQRRISETDGRGSTTRTVYDSLGRVSSTIDALGYATTYGYDALGRQTSVTDPLTNTVTTAYDAEVRVKAVGRMGETLDLSNVEAMKFLKPAPRRTSMEFGILLPETA